jgi:hypothetical protein
VVAAKALNLESGAGIQRDRAGVIDPDFERDLVGLARPGVVLNGGEQRSAAAATPRAGEDRHPDRQDPRGGLLHRRVAYLTALVVLENPQPGRVSPLDDPAQALGPLFDVDRWLGTQEPFGSDGGHDAGRIDHIGDTGPADDHAFIVSP